MNPVFLTSATDGLVEAIQGVDLSGVLVLMLSLLLQQE